VHKLAETPTLIKKYLGIQNNIFEFFY
jgi:hypothetical protein